MRIHKTNYEMNVIKDYFFDNLNKNNIIEDENKEIKEKKGEEIENNILIENEIINDNNLNISSNSLMIERQKHTCPENK